MDFKKSIFVNFYFLLPFYLFFYLQIQQKTLGKPKAFYFRGDNRNRTDDEGVADPCLTAWLCRHILFSMTPTGIEPVLPP